LLADTNLEVLHLGFLERLVIVARHGIRQVLVHIAVLRQDGHNREIFVAGRAEGPETFYIRDGHNLTYFSMQALVR